MPLYAMGLYYFVDHFSTRLLRESDPWDYYYKFLLILSFMSIIVPVVSLMIMKRAGIISSLQLPDRVERLPAISLTFVYYAITYYLFLTLNETLMGMIGIFISVMAGGLVTMLLCLVITMKWKISLHAIGIAGLAGSFIGMMEVLHPVINLDLWMYVNFMLILSIGIVAAARVYLSQHSLLQVMAGSVLGFGVQYICVKYAFFI